MKFSCTKENLYRGLFFTAHIAGKTSALPILGNVLLEAKNGALSLVTTNLELGVRASVRGKVDEEGSFTVNAKLLADYVSLLPNGRVDVELISNKDTASSALLIKAGELETTMIGSSPEEFPLLPNVERLLTVVVPARDLRAALAQVLFSAAQDEGRPELQGVYISIDQSILTLAATDSFRLAERKITLAQPLASRAEIFSAIIPAKSLAELGRILSALEEPSPVELSFAANQVVATAEGVEFLSRLVDRKYPDYRQVIPIKSETTARLPKSEVLTAVRSASLFCRTGVNDVRLDITKAGVTVTASGARGAHSARVLGECNGADVSLLLNYRYLLEGLNAIGDPNIRLEIVSASQPCILRSAEPVGASEYLYLIMPIKQ